MANTCRGAGADAPRSSSGTGAAPRAPMPSAQRANSSQRSKIACGSLEKRPSLSFSTSTTWPSTKVLRRPLTLASLTSFSLGCPGPPSRDVLPGQQVEVDVAGLPVLGHVLGHLGLDDVLGLGE